MRCLPVMELTGSYKGVSEHETVWSATDWKDVEKKDDLNLDQSTEIILAFTLLVIIVLTFIL